MDKYPNTYQAVRVINGPKDIPGATNANLLYVKWCTGEQELYNMTNDPDQVHNLVFAATRTATKTSDGDNNHNDDNSNNPRTVVFSRYYTN